MNVNKSKLFLMTSLSIIGIAAVESSVNIPYTFTSDPPALASEVNANFNELKAAVDDNDFRLGLAETSVADHEARLNTLENAGTCSPGSGFVDNGDGTICDLATGLMWEKKLASGDARCADRQASRHVSCQNNVYDWTASSAAPDGTMFTEFLPKLNRDLPTNTSSDGNTVVDTGGSTPYTDWRIPDIEELKSIVDLSNCPPCIDPVFGPTQASYYWSSRSYPYDPDVAWNVFFGSGGVGNDYKIIDFYARAVRGGR